MRDIATTPANARGAFIPVDECVLDAEFEQLQRQHASASRAAAEIRSARLMRVVDALEERLENE